jgi:PPK2 family polyphosphate:nucleotide phosphotransferase
MIIDPDLYRVQPGEHLRLDSIDPEDTGGFDGDKTEGKEQLEKLTGELEVLQERLFAQHKHGVLLVLQGMDTSGKDGVIEHVFEGVNPQGVRVASFKAPTPLELEHDFLWRVHPKVPAKGEIVIFNRSHYEDVLVVRVRELAPEKVWSRRYSSINDFERLLAAEGTVILKFYLHISKEEQKNRLLDRLNEPEKRWKFNPDDLKERKRWDSYTRAYEDALSITSTEWAPWYVVPANRKWFRNLVIAGILVKALRKLNPQPPDPLTEDVIRSCRETLEKE